MPMHNGKFISGHLKAHPANRPGKEMPNAKLPDKGMPASQKPGMHEAPKTEPHPTTGVHSIHSFHVGGGKYVTQTHHEPPHSGAAPMEDHHENASMMHAHMQEHMPDEEHNDQDPEDQTGEEVSSDLSGLGGGMDDAA